MFSYEKKFVKEIQSFLDATGRGPTQFGKDSPIKDPGFLRALKLGRSPTARTMDKVRQWMAKERPDVISKNCCK